MAELPFNIVINIFEMVCPAICFESCPKKSKIATKPQRGYGNYKYMFCFISHFILL